MEFSLLKPFEKKAFIFGLLLMLVCSMLLLKEVFWRPISTSDQGQAIGTIKVFGFDVRQKSNSDFSWKQLESNTKVTTAVYENDSIFVGPDSSASVEITGGVKILLEANSLIVLRFQESDLALTLKFGDFAAVFAAEPQRPLLVQSGNHVFEVLGVNSKVQIKKQSLNEAKLSVVSGSIKIRKSNLPDIQEENSHMVAENKINMQKTPVARSIASEAFELEMNKEYLVSGKPELTNAPMAFAIEIPSPSPTPFSSLTPEPSPSPSASFAPYPTFTPSPTLEPKVEPLPEKTPMPVSSLNLTPIARPKTSHQIKKIESQKIKTETKEIKEKNKIPIPPTPAVEPKPEIPTILSPKLNSTFAFERKNNLIFKWEPNSKDLERFKKNEFEFEIELSMDQNFSKLVVRKIVNSNQFLYNSHLPIGKIYWHVRTRNLKNKDFSEWSTLSYFFSVSLNQEEPPE